MAYIREFLRRASICAALVSIMLAGAGCLPESKPSSTNTAVTGARDYISVAPLQDGTGMVYSRAAGREVNIFYRKFDSTGEIALTWDSNENILLRGGIYGDKIVFSSNRSGSQYRLYTLTLTSTQPVEIVADAKFNLMDPAFSKDGTRIVFAAIDANNSSVSQIFSCASDGSDLKMLTSSDSMKRKPTLSTGGSWVMFQKKGEQKWGLYYVDIVSGDKVERIFLAESSFDSFDPEFLPKSAKEFTGDEELLYVRGVTGTSVRIELVYFVPGSDGTLSPRESRVVRNFSDYYYYNQPSVSNDGKLVLHLQKYSSANRYDIIKTDLYGNYPTQISY